MPFWYNRLQFMACKYTISSGIVLPRTSVTCHMYLTSPLFMRFLYVTKVSLTSVTCHNIMLFLPFFSSLKIYVFLFDMFKFLSFFRKSVFFS